MHKVKVEKNAGTMDALQGSDHGLGVEGYVPTVSEERAEMQNPYLAPLQPGVLEHIHTGGPGCVYHQVTITETTNDKEWMHRNMDLTDIGKRIDALKAGMAMFAVGVMAMIALLWILTWSSV